MQSLVPVKSGLVRHANFPQRAGWGLLTIACALAACEPSPLDRCVSARLKVWDSNSEKTPWRISEATGQTRSQFEAKARSWCEQEKGQ
jgi:hypothetical protein